MFLIGIELSFNRLMMMRHLIFGLGGLQVAGSIMAIAGFGWVYGLSAQAALLIGAAFSLPSIVIFDLGLDPCLRRLQGPPRC